jgi:hypothetical protein
METAIQEILPVQEEKGAKDNKTFKLQIRLNRSERNMVNEMRQLDNNFSISNFIRDALLKAYNEAKSKANPPQ